ncbi:DISARM system phospholipase D-like protein DrmC [Klenkia sp. PcliD-1-E]|uniref:DISARM system phospholipase D-like protein DrmC n=1 Tax=Klenkia sp. PcliD-1-E TaxID=2954492 RepID=UPI002097E8EA|nr:DISARM system phospholipase D-like protein DrmC [Klenkia sp. PcliD-1-E]MCO7218474.1 DISARM system phospholipase D-like protein DrmC [Klenkia sp. PcliD-1-E]
MRAAADLGAFLTKDEAKRIGGSLDLGHGLLHQAVKSIHADRRERVLELLDAALAALAGDVRALSAVLSALSGVPRAARPQLVWTSPSLPHSEGRTTLAASQLINEAQSYVYAATYSATMGSSYVAALREAVARGVAVTLVVDQARQAKTATQLAGKLAGARIWTMSPPGVGEYAVQHSKIVMIDGLAALVTSANFSSAAAETNLECGVLLRDAALATSIKTHLDQLHENQFLVDYSA